VGSTRLLLFSLAIGSGLPFTSASYAAKPLPQSYQRLARKQRTAQNLDPNAAAAAPKPSNVAQPKPAPANTTNTFEEEDMSKSRNNTMVPPTLPPDNNAAKEERPPTKLPSRTKTAGSDLPPEAWDPRRSDVAAQNQRGRDHAGDYDEDSGVGVGTSIGFGARSFSAGLSLTFPIYRWLAWRLSGSYYTTAYDNLKESKYGPEGDLILRIPSRIPITPYAGLGAGYDKWARFKDEAIIDDSGSLYSAAFVGISIPLAKHLALDMSETWKTYLGRPPRAFEDTSKYENYGSRTFNLGLAVVF
jgi:hypothetical protein